MQTTDSELRELRDLILGMDKKMDIFIARTDERFNSIDDRFKSIDDRFKSIDQRLECIEKRIDAQDTRTFGLIISAVIGLMGLLAKLTFFPDVKS